MFQERKSMTMGDAEVCHSAYSTNESVGTSSISKPLERSSVMLDDIMNTLVEHVQSPTANRKELGTQL